jgi:hypothetical protein
MNREYAKSKPLRIYVKRENVIFGYLNLPYTVLCRYFLTKGESKNEVFTFAVLSQNSGLEMELI